MKKLIQLLEANIKLNSSGCPNIGVDSDISLNLVNDVLLNGICRAAKAAGVNVQITSAVSDHPEKTDSGAISRHSKGQAVDISKINGKSVKDPSNKTNVDNFVSQLEILGYAHNQGAGGANNWLNTGKVGSDGFGTKGTKYTELIANNFRKKIRTNLDFPRKSLFVLKIWASDLN
jgi:hypothetical protein